MLKAYFQKSKVEAGCDEAGRGCLAGPVFAAAVILPKNFKNEKLDDSKKLTAEERYALREIIEKEALDFSVQMIDNNEIDQINILQASIKAMHLSLDGLKTKPNSLLIDGNRFIPYQSVKHHCIIKGDGIFSSIAAASILAKTYRDDFMQKMHFRLPKYYWDTNKGYPTKAHRAAIKEFGISSLHRKSFRLLPENEMLNMKKGITLF